MPKEELIPGLIFYWVIFSIGYRFLGFNFALHFSGFGKEEFKKNISSSSKSHWYASLVIGLIISFMEILIFYANGRLDGCFSSPKAEITLILRIIYGVLVGLSFGEYSCEILIKNYESKIASKKFIKTIPAILLASTLFSTLFYMMATNPRTCVN